MQPRTLHIYWAEHERHLPPVSEAGMQLPDAVHRRWKQYRTVQQQNMSLLAKRLLHYGLQQLRLRMTGGLADLNYQTTGKPYLACLPVHFSLSHSKQVAVCVLSDDAPVGIDIQERMPTPAGSEGLFLSPSERQNAGTDDRLLLWCCKEAAFKAVGFELGAPLRRFQFTGPLRVECPPVTLELIPQFIRPGYVCYLAVPIDEHHPRPPVRITIEHVHHPY